MHDNHILVHGGCSPKGRFENRFILNLPIEVMYGFVDRVVEVVVSEHREPAEVEGASQIEAGCHSHSIVTRIIRSCKLSFRTSWGVAISCKTEHISIALVAKASHESDIVIATVVDI